MIPDLFSNFASPSISKVIGAQLQDEFETAHRFLTLFWGSLNWFEDLEVFGFERIDIFKGCTEEVIKVIDQIDDSYRNIQPHSPGYLDDLFHWRHLFGKEFLDDVEQARRKIAGKFKPIVPNAEVRYVGSFKFASAFHSIEDLYNVYRHLVLRHLRDAKSLVLQPDNYDHENQRTPRIGYELAYIWGKLSSMPELVAVEEFMTELEREVFAVSRLRRSGESWSEISNETSEDDGLLDTPPQKIQSALDFIAEKQPVKAIQIARQLDIEESSFYRHYAKPLKAMGVVSDRRHGYKMSDETNRR